jgi:hypothetical protein
MGGSTTTTSFLRDHDDGDQDHDSVSTAAEDTVDVPDQHHSISLPSTPQPADKLRYVQFAKPASAPVMSSPSSSSQHPAKSPYTMPMIPFPNLIDSSSKYVQQDRRHPAQFEPSQQQQQQMERTPHNYEYVPGTAVEPDAPCQSSSSSSSFRAGEYYYPNHFDTSSYNAVIVSPTSSSSSSNNTIRSTNGWFPVFPTDVSIPEDDDEKSNFPVWGRSFQCMDDDGIQAYERCIERRYRPCQP